MHEPCRHVCTCSLWKKKRKKKMRDVEFLVIPIPVTITWHDIPLTDGIENALLHHA